MKAVLSLTGSWEFRQIGKADWQPATVPGGVHTDLLALKQIPDPFVGDNEKKVSWVAEADWEYRRSFTPDAALLQMEKVWLVCDGLDTLATVILNGKTLGKTNNMYRQYRWDIKSQLKAGANEITIRFDSPVKFCADQQAKRYLPGVSQAIDGGPHLRKAPCQFGWDWGPQLPPIGIWQDIRVEGYQSARVEEVQFVQHHQSGKVTVSAHVQVERWDKAALSATLTITGPDGKSINSSTALATEKVADLSVEIANPQLWWPNGYGQQPLYKAVVSVEKDGKALDRKDFQLGLRTLELRQEPDEWGKSFTFVVNGKPIFAKGSNWIPTDTFPTNITSAWLERLIADAAATHQNMLRVWGGGFFEEERFYDICDRYGILIWQDFIFSCSIYPLDEADFLANVEVEVRENIRRLRHRASLALWCGNNEMEQGWVEWNWKKDEYQGLKAAYDKFFHHTLKQWCNEEDPSRTYWPSSPSSDTPFENPNGQKQGDAHYWDVWHGRKPFTAYRNQFPRFMSEFGFQALPPLETIRTYAAESDWNMTSYIMERHQKNDSGNQLMVAQMLDTFRLPNNFDSLVYLSLALQAEGIRYGVEHWRRHPERVSGIIYWQLNDCWPVASWSSIDYYGRWKALHYAARKFFAPVMMSIENQPTRMDVYLTNETDHDWEGSLRWSLESLTGIVKKTEEVAVTAAANKVTSICQPDFAADLDDEATRDTIFNAELIRDGKLVSRQTAYFVPAKHLNLTDPHLRAEIRIEGDRMMIDVSARSFAELVECTFDGVDVVLSDNYFDLPAGRKVTLSAPLPAGRSVATLEQKLRVRSVYDSYEHGTTN